MRRIDSTPLERFDKRDAIIQIVVLDEIAICRNDGSQILAKGYVRWRTIVERSNAHRQDMLGRFRSLSANRWTRSG